MREATENFFDFEIEEEPSGEDASQASFYFFIQDLKFYLQSEIYKDLIWDELEEEEKEFFRRCVKEE